MTQTEIDGSSGTSGDRESRFNKDGVGDMDRNRRPGRRVATDAQGGTNRAKSLGRSSASV
jgi:hypothetical protein